MAASSFPPPEIAALEKENEKLKKTLAQVDKLIAVHQTGLLEIAKTSAELEQIEKKRAEVKERLHRQKIQAYLDMTKSFNTSNEVKSVLETKTKACPDQGPMGKARAECIMKIQKAFIDLVQSSIDEQDSEAIEDRLCDFIVSTSDTIQEAIDCGAVLEPPELTQRRQDMVIRVLAGDSDDDDEDDGLDTM